MKTSTFIFLGFGLVSLVVGIMGVIENVTNNLIHGDAPGHLILGGLVLLGIAKILFEIEELSKRIPKSEEKSEEKID